MKTFNDLLSVAERHYKESVKICNTTRSEIAVLKHLEALVFAIRKLAEEKQ